MNNSNFEIAEPSFYGRGSPQQQSKTESCQEFGRSEKVEIVIDVKLNRLWRSACFQITVLSCSAIWTKDSTAVYAGLKGEWSPEASYGKVNYLNWNHPHSSGWSSSKHDRGEIQRGRLDPGCQGVQHHQGCRPCRTLGAG